MTTILDRIASYKREEVAAARLDIPVRELEVMALDAPPVRDFVGALERKISAGEFALIAEIKKASPVKGVLFPDLDAVGLSREYSAAGAAAISVLTDEHFFQGPQDQR